MTSEELWFSITKRVGRMQQFHTTSSVSPFLYASHVMALLAEFAPIGYLCCFLRLPSYWYAMIGDGESLSSKIQSECEALSIDDQISVMKQVNQAMRDEINRIEGLMRIFES